MQRIADSAKTPIPFGIIGMAERVGIRFQAYVLVLNYCLPQPQRHNCLFEDLRIILQSSTISVHLVLDKLNKFKSIIHTVYELHL